MVVGVSWLVVLPMVAIGMFVAIDPELGSMPVRILVASGGSLLVWASIFVHELGHVTVALRLGIAVKRVGIFILGGFSEMDLDAAGFEHEWRVAAAGPIASGALGVVLVVGGFALPAAGGLASTFVRLAMINGGVAVFNLLPAFPLDGGRMLRASLMRRGNSSLEAVLTASRTGLAVGGAIITVGMIMSLVGALASLVVVSAGLLIVVLTRTHFSDILKKSNTPPLRSR